METQRYPLRVEDLYLQIEVRSNVVGYRWHVEVSLVKMDESQSFYLNFPGQMFSEPLKLGTLTMDNYWNPSTTFDLWSHATNDERPEHVPSHYHTQDCAHEAILDLRDVVLEKLDELRGGNYPAYPDDVQFDLRDAVTKLFDKWKTKLERYSVDADDFYLPSND